MMKLLLRGTLVLAMLTIAAGVRAQTYGDPVTKEIPALKIVAVDEKSSVAGWRRFQFGEPVLFSALLPGKPDEHATRISGSDGAMIVRAYFSLSATAIYSVVYGIDLPGAVESKTVEQQQRAFKNFIYGFANGFGRGEPGKEAAKFTITAERSAKVGGIDGYEKEFTLGDYQGHAQMAFRDQRRIALITLWGEKNPQSERASFFNSFRLSPRR